jgi:hypothetical protein
MSDLDYEKLEEDIIGHILETNKARTADEAEALLNEWIDEYEEHLWLMNREARLRNIAQIKCGIQVGRPIEEFTEDAGVRTIQSLENAIPEYNLIIEAKIRSIKVRTISTGKKLADITISDGTGNSKITVWEQEAEAVENGELAVGDIIRIHGAYSAEPYSDYEGFKVEIKKAKTGRIERNPDGVEVPEPISKTIADLAEGMTGVALTGKIQKIWERKQTSRGKDYLNASISDKDGNSIFLKVWREDLVNMIDGPRVNEGDIITATDLRVDSWQGRLGVNTTDITEIIFADDENPDEYPEISFGSPSGVVPEDKHLVVTRDGDRIKFVGKIVRIYGQKPYYDSCPNPTCLKGIKTREDGSTYCVNGCEQALTQPPVPVARVSGLIADGTAVLRFSAMGSAAEKIVGLSPQTIKDEFDALYNSSEETEDWKRTGDAAKVFTEVFQDRMLQGFVKVIATAKLEKDYRGTLELMIYEIEPTDYDKQAEIEKARIMEMVQEPAR